MKKDKGKNIMDTIIIETSLGTVAGRKTDGCLEFLGIPYAKAERFRYAESIEHFEGVLDATEYGNACPQYRQYFPQLDNPERLFYHREFRQGIPFHYDEDCLNLNIFTPENPDHCPVAVFIHGGGFNSGSNAEEPFRGYELAKRGIITVFINYRVGIFGYLTHADIQKEYGRDGNFGLDDQLTALKWVKRHIADFGGDSENITVCGQSAGAMSIQYLCLNHDNAGLFRRVLMMSGAGLFPKFASPREAEVTREYWLQLMDSIGCTSLEELRSLDAAALLSAAQDLKGRRKDTLYNTMPVIDGVLIKGHIDELIHRPLPVGYMIGYTNTAMDIMNFYQTKLGDTVGGTFVIKALCTSDRAVGDVNRNGKFTIIDVTLTQRHLALIKSLDEDGTRFADVDNNGVTDVFDVTRMKRRLALIDN